MARRKPATVTRRSLSAWGDVGGRAGRGSAPDLQLHQAPGAAGVIHSDFERGFIKADCYASDDLFALGSEQAVKEKGLLRSEGKEYVVKDGDILFFKFNV